MRQPAIPEEAREPRRRRLGLAILGFVTTAVLVAGWAVIGDRVPRALSKCGSVDSATVSISDCWVLPYAQFRGAVWPTSQTPHLRALLWWMNGEDESVLPVSQDVVSAVGAGDGHDVPLQITRRDLLHLEYEYQGARIRLPRWGGPYLFTEFETHKLLMFMTTPNEVDSRRAILGYVLWKGTQDQPRNSVTQSESSHGSP